MKALDVHLRFLPSQAADVARTLRDRMPDQEWAILCALAAELVALHEARAQGTRIVVAQSVEEAADLPAALRLPVARA